ncbi:MULTISPECIES: YihY/virulence factor BrkB family protein [unclassified Leucobacter]|uniref:YihY/virulence factor BrkB family protein n=1 Tax=unclassified Leucobacter TaxID=2621730 RepID=UPI00165D7548|nr:MULTISPECIES: YihY/virulence factor BrkB family protein [unclassified Leucobacter]MBC9936354.1 YihY/virulence factor BrkB family protein [Leucobacter sp. cx-87]
MDHEPRAKNPQGLGARAIAWALRLSIVRAALHYAARRGPLLADSVTYRALFSVFAGVLLLFSAAGLWLDANPDARRALVDTVNGAIPGIGDAIDLDQAQLSVGFTLVGAVSVLGLVAAAIGAIGSLRAAFRSIADVTVDETNFLWMLLRNFLVALAFGGLLLAGAAVSLLSSSGRSLLADWLGVSEDAVALEWGARLVGLGVVIAINTLAVAVAFRLLAGVRPAPRALWAGSVAGGVGLLVLQEFSGLFVRGAASNPLLASFATLIALLLWINLSVQVILIASSLIVTLEAQAHDRVHEKYGAPTLADFRRREAEKAVAAATAELRAAQGLRGSPPR